MFQTPEWRSTHLSMKYIHQTKNETSPFSAALWFIFLFIFLFIFIFIFILIVAFILIYIIPFVPFIFFIFLLTEFLTESTWTWTDPRNSYFNYEQQSHFPTHRFHAPSQYTAICEPELNRAGFLRRTQIRCSVSTKTTENNSYFVEHSSNSYFLSTATPTVPKSTPTEKPLSHHWDRTMNSQMQSQTSHHRLVLSFPPQGPLATYLRTPDYNTHLFLDLASICPDTFPNYINSNRGSLPVEVKNQTNEIILFIADTKEGNALMAELKEKRQSKYLRATVHISVYFTRMSFLTFIIFIGGILQVLRALTSKYDVSIHRKPP